MRIIEQSKNIGRMIRTVYIQHKCQNKDFSVVSEFHEIMIVAPHPDDEVFGCSGLIQRLIENGKKVHIVILSGGGKSHQNCCLIDELTLMNFRRDLSRKAAKILGIPLSQVHFFNYPDGQISFDNTETQQLQVLIRKLSPDAIFIPHKGEGWNDHVEAGNIIKKLVVTLSSSIQLYEYCVWFWYYNVWNIDWKNAFVLKMNEKEYQLKLKAIDVYVKPLAPCGKPWSGVLPKIFVKANQWNCELYFKIK